MMLPKCGTLFTYGRADVISIFFLPCCGSFLLGCIGILTSLNYLISSGVAYTPFFFYFAFYFFSSLFSAFLTYLWAPSSSFFFFLASAANLFSNFLNCCFDNPILYPSERVYGSFLPYWLSLSSCYSWCVSVFYCFY